LRPVLQTGTTALWKAPLSLDVAMDVAIAEEKHFTLILKTRAGSRLKITDETL